MSRLTLLLTLSAVASFLLTAWITRRADVLRLVQTPNARSSHVLPPPSSGGVGIVLAATAVGGLFAWEHPYLLWGVLGLGVPIAFIGLLDDIHHLSIGIRIAVQTAVFAGLLVLLGDMPPLTLFGGLALDGVFLWCVLLVSGVWWINLFNFMDGIDGIAGSQAVVMLLLAAALTAWFNVDAITSPVWILILCIAMATVGFLFLNWAPARIFMGDVGSNWLAFTIFAVALLTIQAGWMSYAAWLVLAAVFVTDATVTLLTRMARGDRWYEAHRSHAYQRLSRRWRDDRNKGHRSVTILVTLTNMLWLGPLAWACLASPHWALVWLAMAYLPLIFGAIILGAGKPDRVGTTST
jgi:Fuc2NAc and GlcNAc transferase